MRGFGNAAYIARHSRRLSQQHLDRHVHRAISGLGVDHQQATIARHVTHDRERTALAVAQSCSNNVRVPGASAMT